MHGRNSNGGLTVRVASLAGPDIDFVRVESVVKCVSLPWDCVGLVRHGILRVSVQLECIAKFTHQAESSQSRIKSLPSSQSRTKKSAKSLLAGGWAFLALCQAGDQARRIWPRPPGGVLPCTKAASERRFGTSQANNLRPHRCFVSGLSPLRRSNSPLPSYAPVLMVFGAARPCTVSYSVLGKLAENGQSHTWLDGLLHFAFEIETPTPCLDKYGRLKPRFEIS